MKLGFIDNSPVDEPERREVAKDFTDYIDKALAGISVEDAETEMAVFKTQRLEAKQGDLMLTIMKRFFRNKPTRRDEPQFEDTSYEISFREWRSVDGKTSSEDEIYRCGVGKCVERMTSWMDLDGTSMSHNTETHEVGKTELAKMLRFVSEILTKERI